MMEQEYNMQAIRLAAKHYFAEMRRMWLRTTIGFICPGVGNVLVFYVPILVIAQILSRFNGTHFTLIQLAPYILAFAGVWLLGEILWRIGLHMLISTESQAINNLYNNALGYLLEKDLGFFNDNFSGSLTKKVTGYARNYEGVIDTLVFNVFSNLIPLIFISVILWRFSPWLPFALVAMTGLSIFVLLPLIRRRQKMVIERETNSNILTGHVADTISNMPAVQTFAQEANEAKIHALNTRRYVKSQKLSWDYQNQRIDIVLAPLYVAINVIGLIIALLVSQHTNQDLKVVFVTFSFYASFTRVMWEFNRIYRNLETNITDAAQFTELLLEPPKVVDPPHPEKFVFKEAGVELQKVSFQYLDKAGEHLFKDLSMDVKPGEKIGLVGRSGGGKTTITKLLLRLMDIQEGQILISGQNIANLKKDDLRQKIAYVPQEPLLFHRSIADNIRYGKLDASMEEVERVAKLAHAHEFVKDLPDGYQTLVGERGVKLSGGQRQRIAIARAMIKDAPILVLDEATSALDSESEVLIQDALWKLMKGRTAIVIAHRLSTVQKMDRIVVLDKGAILEQGSHNQLLASKGIYSELWAHQSGGFIEE